MRWSGIKGKAKGVSHYSHVVSNTSVGKFVIEWKQWEPEPSYDVLLNNGWVGFGDSLGEAKQVASDYLDSINK